MTQEEIARRCIMDFVRRGGVYEGNVFEIAARVVESLKLFGMMSKQEDEMSLQALQQAGNGQQIGGNSLAGLQYSGQREQELRMRCLEMANRQPFGGTKNVIACAQAMYDFAMGNVTLPASAA